MVPRPQKGRGVVGTQRKKFRHEDLLDRLCGVDRDLGGAVGNPHCDLELRHLGTRQQCVTEMTALGNETAVGFISKLVVLHLAVGLGPEAPYLCDNPSR